MDELIQALQDTGFPFAHFGWSKAPAGDYGVYSEEGTNDLIASNRRVNRAIRMTIDFFTRLIDKTVTYAADGQPYDTVQTGLYSWFDHHPAKTAIESALENCACAWYLNSIQFESDTGYVHVEWVVECIG